MMATSKQKDLKFINRCWLTTIISIFFIIPTSIAAEQKDLIEYSQERTKTMSGKAMVRETTIKNNVATLQSERILINAGDLIRKDRSVSFLLPDGIQRVTFAPTKRYPTKHGNLVWEGHSENGRATFIINKGIVTGIFTVNGREFKITPIDKVNRIHILAEIDSSKLPPEADICPDLGDCEEPIFPPPPPPPETTPSLSTIRILVAFTPAADAQTLDINQLIDLFIAQTNETFAHSEVNDWVSVELAFSAETAYNEVGRSFSQHLDALRDVDGRMDELLDLREQHGADVVALIVEDNQYCGLANGINVTAAGAFFVIHRPCTGFTFPHELGHLMGTRHNPEADSTSTPYAYGHGYQAPDQSFRTVMSTNCTNGCVREPHWSDPNVFHNSQSTGTAELHDNVRVIEGRAAAVADFRDTPTSSLPIPNLSVQPEFCFGLNFADWNSVAGATSYRLYQSSSTNSDNAYQIYSGTATSKLLNVSSTQYLWVKACDNSGCSSFSNMGKASYFSICY